MPGYRLWGPQTFSYHQFCLNIYPPLLSVFPNIAKSRNDLLSYLNRSLAPALSIRNPPRTVQVLQNSLCQQTLARIICFRERARQSSIGRCGDNCACTVCLIHRLYRLPNELLSEFIAPHLVSGDLPQVISNFSETFNMLATEIQPQSGRILRGKALFVTRITFMAGPTSAGCIRTTSAALTEYPETTPFASMLWWN